MIRPPTHDKAGLHILDPKDGLGHKSQYITLVQEKALHRYIPAGTGQLAVDVGCGFGRLTPILAEKGWRAIGIDPDPELIAYARSHHPDLEFREGGLPDLPLEPGSVELLLLQNVLRALKIMGRLQAARGLGRYVTPGGRVLVVDNIRLGHPDFVPEHQLLEMMRHEELDLVERIPIRSARWWLLYLIRYGLIPGRFFNAIADGELSRMARRTGSARWQYWNVLFIFKKRM